MLLGGEFEGEWVHVYVWLSPFCSPETVIALLISFTAVQNKNFFLKGKKNCPL